MRKFSKTVLLVAATGMALSAGSVIAIAQSADQTDEAPPADDFSDIEAARQAEENGAPPPVVTPDGDAEIPPERMEALDNIAQVVAAIDSGAKRQGNNWELTIDDTQLLVVTDVTNGRMRIMTPIAPAESLPAEALMRLMQANFDSALDARYAIAQDLVWATFIHSLDDVSVREIASGMLQTKTLRDTFGTTFSSGALSFGGGDSNAIIGEQLQELLDQLEQDNTI